MVHKNCRIQEVDTGGVKSARFDLLCDNPSRLRGTEMLGTIETYKSKLRGRSVWIVDGIYVYDDERRKGHATRLYSAAAEHACRKQSALASTGRTPGAYSNDFWNKQLIKGRAKRIPRAGQNRTDAFVLDVCGINIDLSGLPEKKNMRTSLEDPLVSLMLAPWLAAPIALMLLLKPATASAALVPTTLKFTRPPAPILSVLKNASAKTGVPLPILIGVAHTETRYNPTLTSSKGAAGLMQLMPKTAESLGVTDRLDPYQSAIGGAKLLKSMYSLYGNWDQALAAYNWGQGNVNKNPEPSQWIPRTRAYVANVKHVAANI